MIRCGFCFRANCTASFKVRCSESGEAVDGCCPRAANGNAPSEKTRSGTEIRRRFAAMRIPPNRKKQAVKNRHYMKTMGFRHGSGFRAGLHGHGDEGTDQDSREKLADDGFSDRKRAGEGMYGQDIAKTDGGQSGKTKIDKLCGELVHIRWLGNKVEGSRVKLFDKVKGGSPSHSEKEISAYAALNAAPGDRALPKHDQQDNADVEKQDDGGENAAEFPEKGRGVEARDPQHTRANNDKGDGDDGRDAALAYHQGPRNHQGNHHQIEEESSGKASLQEREDHEDENHK